MSEDVPKRRSIWPALLLSFLGCPLGHVYAGYLQRAVVFWAIGLMLLPAVALCCVTLPLGQAGFIAFGSVVLCFPFIQAIDAVRLALRPIAAKKLYQRWWVYLMLMFFGYILNVAGAYFTKTYVAEVFKITSRAMAPTLVHGDRILVDKFWTTPNRMNRNSIVVYHNAEDDALHVMRVVALAEDEVRIQKDKFLLNGKEASVPSAHSDAEPIVSNLSSGRDVNDITTRVPGDSFFVLGDNRNMAFDSRYVGSIPGQRLYGTAVNILWSRPVVSSQPNAPIGLKQAEVGPIAWWRIGLPLY